MLSARLALVFSAIANLGVVGWCANAMGATVDECLSASDASFRSASEGKLRAERAQLLVCAAPACPREVRKECLRRVEELNVAIPTVVFEVKDNRGADIADVKVWMDEEMLSEHLGGSALAVDPGEHTFRFESPGHAEVERRVLIRESEKDRRVPIRLPESVVAAGRGGQHSPGSNLNVRKVTALTAGGIGLIGVGIGTVFGIETFRRKHSAQSVCPEEQCATQEGVDRWHDAKSAGNIATAAFIAGGAVLAGAAVLWFTDGSGPEKVQVGVGVSGLRVKGTW